jgi:hypothetical protein
LFDTTSQKLILFPNPVQSKLNIRYWANNISTTLLQVFSLSGQLVLQDSTKVIVTGVQELQINTSKLFKGTYLYCLQQGGETTYGKFIKL